MRLKRALVFLLCVLSLLSAGCTPESDWVIPDDYKTYDDPAGLYSISYPAEWRVSMELVRQVEAYIKDYVKQIDEGLPIERATLLFLAGIPHGSNYHPNVNIVIEPLPTGMHSLRSVVNAAIAGTKAVAASYTEISRDKVKVGGRNAYIIEYQASLSNLGSVHGIMLLTMTDANIWSVTCSSLEGLDDFDEFADDFQATVRSLRVYE